jgi:hypothetical protein
VPSWPVDEVRIWPLYAVALWPRVTSLLVAFWEIDTIAAGPVWVRLTGSTQASTVTSLLALEALITLVATPAIRHRSSKEMR